MKSYSAMMLGLVACTLSLKRTCTAGSPKEMSCDAELRKDQPVPGAHVVPVAVSRQETAPISNSGSCVSTPVGPTMTSTPVAAAVADLSNGLVASPVYSQAEATNDINGVLDWMLILSLLVK